MSEMSSLVLASPATTTLTSADDIFMGEKVPLEAIPDPQRFHVVLKQYNLRSKIGSVLLPETAVADRQWSHGMGIVVKVGPSVYRGAKFEDVGLTPEMGPQVGELYWFSARAPMRILVDGELYLLMSDDALLGKFNKNHINRVRFE